MRRREISSRRLARALLPAAARRAVQVGWQKLSDTQQWAVERRLGIATTGRLYLDEVGKDAPGAVHYEPCQWLPTRRALRALRPGPRDVVVDLGCGRGQALVIAGLEPYGPVIGVDFVDQL